MTSIPDSSKRSFMNLLKAEGSIGGGLEVAGRIIEGSIFPLHSPDKAAGQIDRVKQCHVFSEKEENCSCMECIRRKKSTSGICSDSCADRTDPSGFTAGCIECSDHSRIYHWKFLLLSAVLSPPLPYLHACFSAEIPKRC